MYECYNKSGVCTPFVQKNFREFCTKNMVMYKCVVFGYNTVCTYLFDRFFSENHQFRCYNTVCTSGCFGMTNWLSDRWGFRINQKMEEILEDEEFRHHLDKEYKGKADFLLKKLREERNQSKTLDQKIKEKQGQIEELMSELDELKQRQKKQQKMQNLQSYKQELREVQSRLRQIEEKDLPGREQIREEETRKRRQAGHDPEDECVQNAIESAVERRLKRQPDESEIEDLRERAAYLQTEIDELEPEEEHEFFMDVEPQEQEVRSS